MFVVGYGLIPPLSPVGWCCSPPSSSCVVVPKLNLDLEFVVWFNSLKIGISSLHFSKRKTAAPPKPKETEESTTTKEEEGQPHPQRKTGTAAPPRSRRGGGSASEKEGRNSTLLLLFGRWCDLASLRSSQLFLMVLHSSASFWWRGFSAKNEMKLDLSIFNAFLKQNKVKFTWIN